MSNHPPQILKQLSTTISDRLSRNSSSELLFNELKHQYKEALIKNGFKSELYYKDSASPTDKKWSARKEKLSGSTFRIIKMCQQISPNFFLKLVDKHFPRTHGLHKIFNRNTIKVSYRCMSNVQQVIKKHNNFIKNKENKTTLSCNWCPLNANYRRENVIYKSTSLTKNNVKKVYLSFSEGELK